MEKITQQEIDQLADVLWWLKGYNAALGEDDYPDINGNHLQAISKVRAFLMDFNQMNEAAPAMLKALKDIHAWLGKLKDWSGVGDPDLEGLREAIKKAETQGIIPF